MKCKDCGENIDNLPDLPNGERAPCPNCGSTVRIFEVSITEEIKVSSHVSLLGERHGKRIGFRESIRNGRSTAADKNDDGTFSHSMLGSSPQGEEDTQSVCRILVQAFNISGESWNNPIPGEGVVDCVATEKNKGHKLNIQVTRAITDKDFWKQVNRKQGYDEVFITKEVLAEYLKKSIENKASDKAIPPDIRKDITLALDATRLPVFGLDGVVEEFKIQYGLWSEILGFNSIWLVCPQPELVWRLDGAKK